MTNPKIVQINAIELTNGILILAYNSIYKNYIVKIGSDTFTYGLDEMIELVGQEQMDYVINNIVF